MEGEWVVNCKFIGADFPSSSAKVSPYIPKDRIVDDTSLPGFRRLSIAMVPDVGKTEGHQYNMRFIKKDDEGGSDRVEEGMFLCLPLCMSLCMYLCMCLFPLRINRRAGVKWTFGFTQKIYYYYADKAFNLKQALESELGNSAVTGIEYNPDKNPNRASINLLPNVSPNAQRIELFWNARSTLPPQQGEEELESFRYVEDIRQVLITPQLQETTTVGDYRHVWELYPLDDGTRTIKGYLSTVVYATPQDPLFQSGPFAPLVVFFHTLTYKPSTAKWWRRSSQVELQVRLIFGIVIIVFITKERHRSNCIRITNILVWPDSFFILLPLSSITCDPPSPVEIETF